MNYHNYEACIKACAHCANICLHCASEDQKEPHHMGTCTQINLECAAICDAAAKLMSLGSKYSKDICRICAEICRKCADECMRHDNEHCKECARACTQCAEECERMASVPSEETH